MSLLYLFGEDNMKISGNPRFSFFEPCGKEAYNSAIINNKITTSNNFSLENYAYKIENKLKNHDINLSELLSGNYDLLGGIFITISDYNYNIDGEFDINFTMDEINFHYNLDKIKILSSLLDKNIIFFDNTSNKTVINLPVELFDSEPNWVHLFEQLDINIKISLSKEYFVRLDFKVIKLENQENREFMIHLSTSSIQKCFHSYEFTCFDNLKIENNFATTNIDTNCGIKQLLWRYKINDTWTTKLIDSVDLCFGANGHNEAIKISQDSYQLYFLNKLMFDKTLSQNQIFDNICLYNFSLNPHCYHPSGDFFRNEYEVNIKHNFSDEFIEDINNNQKISISLITNETKFIKYYKNNEEDEKIRCKYFLSRDL
jgi:hypothetical protein